MMNDRSDEKENGDIVIDVLSVRMPRSVDNNDDL
jgi:hypothetical protein